MTEGHICVKFDFCQGKSLTLDYKSTVSDRELKIATVLQFCSILRKSRKVASGSRSESRRGWTTRARFYFVLSEIGKFRFQR